MLAQHAPAPVGHLVGQWREANRRASNAERILLDGETLFAWGLAAAPTEAERQGALAARQAERALFDAASALFTPQAVHRTRALS